MSGDNWTPGPWRIERCPCGHSGCRDYFVEPVGPHMRGDGVKIEDARLIAAAPELYEALKVIRENADSLADSPKSFRSRTMEIADWALAKARGEDT